MSNKLVWSSNMTRDFLLNMSSEDLRSELVDYGYDEELLAKFSDNELRDLVMQDADDVFWEDDIEVFDSEVVPMINSQCKDGIVLMSGTAGTWRGDFKAGKALTVEELISGDTCSECDEIRIDDVDGALVWSGCHHDGCHHMRLYALPEDELKLRDFVDACMGGAVDLELRYGEDISRDEAIEIVKQALDINYINDYCDFSKVPEVCEPIRNTNHVAEEALEEPVEEACIKEDIEAPFNIGDRIIFGGPNWEEDNHYQPFAGAEVEVESVDPFILKPLNIEGKDYIDEFMGDMPTAEEFFAEIMGDNEDGWVEIIRAEAPVEEACVNEDEVLPEVEEPIEEAESVFEPIKLSKINKEELAREIEELREDHEDFGPDGFYAVPFESFKREFPEFTNGIIYSWLTKMELETPEELNDKVMIEDLWADGELIQPDDWNALFDGVDILLKGANVQWDKVWKKYYKTPDKY